MNTVNIDSHKVETNDTVICGNNNVVFGNNNKIYGNSNKVYGNNNAVIGNDNMIKGQDNKAEGSGNEVSTPFGSLSQDPSVPFTSAPSVPQASTPFSSEPAPVSRNAPMNSYPTTTGRARSATFPLPAPVYPIATSPTPFSSAQYPMSTSPVPTYAPAPVQFTQAIVPVMPVQQPYQATTYINPFTGAIVPVAMPMPMPVPVAAVPAVNPFESFKTKEKEVDLIQDGTLVFMIKEWESDYVREFCQLVAMNSGQKVGWHVSCGRTCVVGLGDLEKIRRAIIELLPQLNMRLREWSWNSFGNKVCSDREVFEKRLFKEYNKDDVECWRNSSPASPASA